MASTDLITYLNYVSIWETESDDNIDCLISEQNIFVKLNDFDSDTAINKEFDELIGLAETVKALTITEDAVKMAADAAAVASFWSFGLGMAAFVALEAEAQIERALISSKSKELNKKLATIDTDISAGINEQVNSYILKYKENNTLIYEKAPAGLNRHQCRAILMQFMAEVHRKSKKLDAATFKQYAESARILYNSEEISEVYDALDELNFSAKSEEDVKKYMDFLVGFKVPVGAEVAFGLVQGVSIAVMAYKMNIANQTIKTCAEAAGLPVEEIESSAFGMMDAVGKFTAGLVVIMSVVDVVLSIIDIVNVVKQCDKMCHELNTTIKENYKSYFNGIRDASKLYRKAIGLVGE